MNEPIQAEEVERDDLLFRVICLDNENNVARDYRVYPNGDIEGFVESPEERAIVFNKTSSHVCREVALERERIWKEVAGKQEIRALITDGFRLSSRDHLQMLRGIARNHADESLNPDWKSAYRALSEAADRLDAMIARGELPLPG